MAAQRHALWFTSVLISEPIPRWNDCKILKVSRGSGIHRALQQSSREPVLCEFAVGFLKLVVSDSSAVTELSEIAFTETLSTISSNSSSGKFCTIYMNIVKLCFSVDLLSSYEVREVDCKCSPEEIRIVRVGQL